MKYFMLVLVSLLSLTSFATKQDTYNTEFDAIIEENIQAEKVLSQQLQNDAGIVREKMATNPSLKIDPREDKGEPDQVVVTSSKPMFKEKKKRIVIRNNEDMKRLSQEVKEATTH